MPVTIKDVAKKAGASISTVSRVINESKPVSEDMKKKVLKVIEETGYVPNPVARSLVMKKSQMIGVVLPEIGQYYIGDFLNGVEEIARMYDYDIVLCNTYGDNEKEIKYIDLLRAKQVAGIIFISDYISQDVIDKINKYNMPSVYYSFNTEDFENIISVDIDGEKAFLELVSHLYDNEKEGKIIYAQEDNEANNHFENLESYFLGACKKLKIDENRYDIINLELDEKKIYNIIKEKIDKKDLHVQSIICSMDELALFMIHAFRDLDYKFGEDIKIATVYDTKMSGLIRPGITAIKRPLYDMGAVSARLIVKQIDDTEIKEKSVILPYKMVIRESSKV